MTFLYLFPWKKPDRISCSRSDLPELRSEVNDILYELISDFDLEVIEVKGNLSERFHQILHQIQQLKN